VSILSHEQLDAARLVGDPAADEVVAALGRDVWAVNAIFHNVHENGEPLPAALPRALSIFFEEHVAPPPWLDRERLARAQGVAARHKVLITVALFCASLPTAYAAARGARVLAATGRMNAGQLDRRVHETAQFVFDVMAEGALGPAGRAVRSIQKVRLIHAAVRAQLQAGGASGEVPINQEDMLGTLFTFSVVVARALRALGASVEDEEAEDLYHLWRVAGSMLGIRESLLPPDLLAACDLADRIGERQLQSSEHGRALMADLLAGMERHVALPALRKAPRYLVRYLVGARVASMLGVPGEERFEDTIALLRLLPRLRGATPIMTRAASQLGTVFLENLLVAKLGADPAAFPMPHATAR
jgi:hypothetical protein